MAILKTRVKQKIATLTTWKTVWESFKPLDGEIIKIKITNNSEAADTPLGSNSGITFPIILSKTGDGTSTLEALAWDYALPTNVFAHNHDGIYATIDHHHNDHYADIVHVHSEYAELGHKHSEYAELVHDHNITAGAVDGIFDITGISGNNSVSYKIDPYTSKQSGKFYTGTTDPTANDRLNYGGNFHATKLYSGGTEVEVKGHTHDGTYSPLEHNHWEIGGESAGSVYAIGVNDNGATNATFYFEDFNSRVEFSLAELKKLKELISTINLIEE